MRFFSRVYGCLAPEMQVGSLPNAPFFKKKWFYDIFYLIQIEDVLFFLEPVHVRSNFTRWNIQKGGHFFFEHDILYLQPRVGIEVEATEEIPIDIIWRTTTSHR